MITKPWLTPRSMREGPIAPGSACRMLDEISSLWRWCSPVGGTPARGWAGSGPPKQLLPPQQFIGTNVILLWHFIHARCGHMWHCLEQCPLPRVAHDLRLLKEPTAAGAVRTQAVGPGLSFKPQQSRGLPPSVHF